MESQRRALTARRASTRPRPGPRRAILARRGESFPHAPRASEPSPSHATRAYATPRLLPTRQPLTLPRRSHLHQVLLRLRRECFHRVCRRLLPGLHWVFVLQFLPERPIRRSDRSDSVLVPRRAVQLQLVLLQLSFGILLHWRRRLHRVPSGLLLPVRLLGSNGLSRGKVCILRWGFV